MREELRQLLLVVGMRVVIEALFTAELRFAVRKKLPTEPAVVIHALGSTELDLFQQRESPPDPQSPNTLQSAEPTNTTEAIPRRQGTLTEGLSEHRALGTA